LSMLRGTWPVGVVPLERPFQFWKKSPRWWWSKLTGSG